MQLLVTVLAFLTALAILIAVHEYGHYRMAVACGVRVLRFSIGMGKPLLRWKGRGPTEFVLSAFPVGGYVKMLDEREAAVPVELRALAFNTQSLRVRAAIVSAGPLANLLLAVLLYAVVNWSGVTAAAPILPSPIEGSLAARAGVRGGERAVRAAVGDAALQTLGSFEDLQWLLTRAAVQAQDVTLEVEGRSRAVVLPFSADPKVQVDAEFFTKVGLPAPFSAAVLGDVIAGGAAQQAGLRRGDVVLQLGSTPVVDAHQLRQLIRACARQGKAEPALWQVRRDGQLLEILVTPQVRAQGSELIGRIDAYIGAPPQTVVVRYGPLDGLWRAVVRTTDIAAMSLRVMGRMVLGDASLGNLSGPLSIADYAGKSARVGFTSYLIFLALISVSLGVLNLLPLPVLDGGHLMYYLWEGLTSRPVPDAWMETLQRGGIAVLVGLMAIALFNDLSRVLAW